MSSHLVSPRLLRATSALTPALGALVVPVALAPTAGAAAPSATAVLSGNGRVLHYTAAAGQTNRVTVTESYSDGSTDTITYVIDDAVPVSAGTGCGHPDSADRTKVSCTVTTVESQSPYSILEMQLADGDDSVALHNATGQAYYSNSIELGTGHDQATGTGSVDGGFWWGEAGDDTITAGDDAIVFTHDGSDTVHANGDGVLVNSGNGKDVLYGGDGGQDLHAGDGDDTVYGGRGDDLLRGDAGDDVMYGNSGNDQLYGGAGEDRLSGGPGEDVVEQD